MTVLIMSRLGAKFGEIWGFHSSFLLGGLSGNLHSSGFLIGAIAIMQKCRFTDTKVSELGNKKERGADYKIAVSTM